MKSPLWYWREFMGLRRCDNERDFCTYCTEKLRTPERIAAYVNNTIYYDGGKEFDGWLQPADTLKSKRGNCTEIAGLNVLGLQAIGYKDACHLVLYGIGADGTPKGHAVAAFQTTDGWRCYIEGSKVVRSALGWPTIVAALRPDWRSIERYNFADYEGNIIKGFGL